MAWAEPRATGQANTDIREVSFIFNAAEPDMLKLYDFFDTKGGIFTVHSPRGLPNISKKQPTKHWRAVYRLKVQFLQ